MRTKNKTILQTYQPINKKRRAVGFICLAIAIMPNGLAPVMFPLAFLLLGMTRTDLANTLYNIKIRVKYR